MEKETNFNELKINYTRDNDNIQLNKGTVGSAGIDVSVNSSGVIPCGTTKLVGTGLCFEVPQNTFMRIVPRSSLGLKSYCTIPNSPGILDSDYRGELGLILHQGYPLDFFKDIIVSVFLLTSLTIFLLFFISFSLLSPSVKGIILFGIFMGFYFFVNNLIDYFANKHGFVYKTGDRLAQIMIEDYYNPEFIEMTKLSTTDRGSGGYGSTGINIT